MAIVLNLIYSISEGFALFVVFAALRTKTKWLYSPNVSGKQ
jgi:hypothetical protein